MEKLEYARYTADIHFRIGKNYRRMLNGLAKASKKSESEIARNILEGAILRRHKKLVKIQSRSLGIPDSPPKDIALGK